MTVSTRPSAVKVRNWFGNLESSPAVVIRPRNADDIAEVLRDSARYPSPVRAIGSNHATSPCGVADGGTVIEMRGLDRIIDIGPDYVTVEAGALYIDVAKELERYGLQFYVHIELGNITIGAAACAGTKDSSMPGPGEFGLISSYATRIKLITPSGDRLEVGEEEPELLQAMRSSYGLFGIIYEVTFKVRPIQALAVHHETFTFDQFARQLPELKARGDSLMMYFYPSIDRITVEFRRYRDPGASPRFSRWQWGLRNIVWKTILPAYAYFVTKYVPIRRLRHALLDASQRIGATIAVLIRGDNTAPADQQIRYPEIGGICRYTFSIWVFPEEEYLNTVRDCLQFYGDYYRKTGYRPNLATVGYSIRRDTSSLLSYSYDGDVMTFDPVSTGEPGWEEFLVAYNEFCSAHNGIPLFNQTDLVTPAQIKSALGERLKTFEAFRRRFDPDDRLLNPYFQELLA